MTYHRNLRQTLTVLFVFFTAIGFVHVITLISPQALASHPVIRIHPVDVITPTDIADGDRLGTELVMPSDHRVIAGAWEKGDGVVYVFDASGDVWSQTARLTAPAAYTDTESFGATVSYGGGRLVVGAPDAGDNFRGDVFVYTDTGSTWVFDTHLPYPSDVDNWGDYFGNAVAATTDTIVASTENNAVHTYRRVGGTWTVAQTLTPTAATATLYGYGDSLTISSDGLTLVVGDHTDNHEGSNTGAAYVYSRPDTGSDWTFAQRLEAPDAVNGQVFGSAIDLGDNTLIIGAPGDNDVGAAYIFDYDTGSGQWVYADKISASDGNQYTYDQFGASVRIDGGRALVGASDTGSYQYGSTYLFERNVGGHAGWTQKAKFARSERNNLDRFGTEVALRGDIALASAGDGSASGTGDGLSRVYQYDLSATTDVSVSGEQYDDHWLPHYYQPGDLISYTLTIANRESLSTAHPSLAVHLPHTTGVGFASEATITPTQTGTGRWNVDLGPLVPPSPMTVVISGRVPSDLPAQRVEYTDTFTITAPLDRDTTNNTITLGNAAELPQASVPAGTLLVDESEGEAHVEVSLSESVRLSDTIVAYSTTPYSSKPATPDADYDAGSGTIRIPAGRQSISITIPLVDDAVEEHDEYFKVDLTPTDTVGAILCCVTERPVKILNDDTSPASIELQEPHVITVSEGYDEWVSFYARLTSQPSALVHATLDSSDETEIKYFVNTAFDEGRWHDYEAIRFRPEDDDLIDGDQRVSITVDVQSSDPRYTDIEPAVMTVIVQDDDYTTTEGDIVLSSAAATVVEGKTVAYDVSLSQQPTGTVEVAVTPGDAAVTANPATVTFGQLDWNTPQKVSLTAADNDVDQASYETVIEHSVSSADSRFQGATAPLTLTVNDDDTAGFTVQPDVIHTQPDTTEKYTLTLTSRPTAPVDVSLAGVGLVITPSQVSIAPGGWDLEHPVTVHATGSGTYTVTHSLTSDDSVYDSLTISDVIVQVQEKAVLTEDVFIPVVVR